MYVFTVLLVLSLMAAVYGIAEYLFHQKRIFSIPVRIHVNGIRGKSSVTRLIGAGLRQGGIRTITKVTGTYPRLILEDGSEAKIYRKAGANIIEQLSIVKFASGRRAQAIVIECMAIQPQYQWITENKMIHSTIGVITNVRPDHIDAMGYTLPEIADALAGTIPRGKHFFTSENKTLSRFEAVCKKNNTVLHIVDAGLVSDEDMLGFRYIEHKENVALALSVCEHLGIERDIALKGMHNAVPDAGVLKLSKVIAYQKTINFYNAFAANDPQSTLMIWNQLKDKINVNESKIILLNNRQDRPDRTRQLTAMIGAEMKDDVDYLFLTGQSTDVAEDLSVKNGIKKSKIINLGLTEPEAVFESVLACTEAKSTVLAIGNMGGMGAGVAVYFENRSLVNG